MKISVIIPSYKPKDYLWECLDSLYNQSFLKENYEVIFVLNGCNEPYYSNIQSYCSEKLSALDILIFQTDEPGVSNARNIGLNLAKGNFITFIDDDDYVSPTFLEQLYKTAVDGFLSVSKLVCFDDKTKIFLPSPITDTYVKMKGNDFSSLLDSQSYFGGPVAKLYQREVIGSRRFNRTLSVGEDVLFNFLISDKIHKVKATSEDAIYFRRIRPFSASFRKESFIFLLGIACKSLYNYTKIILLHPFKYNLLFYFTRCAAAIYGIYSSYLNRKEINKNKSNTIIK